MLINVTLLPHADYDKRIDAGQFPCLNDMLDKQMAYLNKVDVTE